MNKEIEYDPIKIGKRLKTARDSTGRTLREMSKISGLSSSAIHGMEIGKFKPNTKYMYLLSTKFDVNLDWIITGRGTMFEPKLDLTWKYGVDSERILEMIYLMENSDKARYELLSRYADYKGTNKEFVKSVLSRVKKE